MHHSHAKGEGGRWGGRLVHVTRKKYSSRNIGLYLIAEMSHLNFLSLAPEFKSIGENLRDKMLKTFNVVFHAPF
jgi:hypothetical protein